MALALDAAVLLLIGCDEELVHCEAMAAAEGVYLAEGDSLLGPQCEEGETARIDLVFADENGALFACYCEAL